jgi:hypothetical protein
MRNNCDMRIERVWAMPNAWTFTIKPIKELLAEEVVEGLWCDPFAGMNSPAQITNDLNPEAKAKYHLDALAFLQEQPPDTYSGVLFDPPYSITQAAECYKSFGKEKLKVNVANMGYWAACKDEVARILRPGGKAIVFGWSTNGIGLNRGFRMERILIVPHGGSKNDTLVTVEVKKT